MCQYTLGLGDAVTLVKQCQGCGHQVCYVMELCSVYAAGVSQAGAHQVLRGCGLCLCFCHAAALNLEQHGHNHQSHLIYFPWLPVVSFIGKSSLGALLRTGCLEFRNGEFRNAASISVLGSI